MQNKIIAILSAIIVLLGGYSATQIGSVVTGSEYNSATVRSTNASGTATMAIKSGQGTVGSVIVTVPASAGDIVLYNATSTTGYSSSTGRVLTKFTAASDVAGTYTFDASFTDGLYVDVPVGFTGEYVITYR